MRKLAVAVLLRPEHQHVARAVHGLERHRFGARLDLEHVLAVVEPVAGGLPELLVEGEGRAHFGEAGGLNDLAHVFRQGVPQDRALGLPEGRARRPGMGHEQAQLLAQLAMIPLLRFGETEQMLIQLLLGEEAVPIDALHRRVGRIALPIGGGGGGVQFEGLDVRRAGQMGAQAEVDEGAHGVALDDLSGLLFDELALEGLAAIPEFLERFRLGQELLLDGPVLLDDVRHLLFDGQKVFRGEGLLHQEVVEETVVGGRTDPALGFREEFGDGGREQVRGRMAIDLDGRVGRLALARRPGQVHHLVWGAAGRVRTAVLSPPKAPTLRPK